jgi:hypothetical protein
MFAARFEDEMHAHGIWGHFNSSAYQPCDADTEGVKSVWEKTERNTRYLLSERLADSTYLRIRRLNGLSHKAVGGVGKGVKAGVGYAKRRSTAAQG